MEEDRCRKARARVYEYLDRELSPVEEARVRRHLAFCEECRLRFHDEAQLLRAIRAQARASPAPERLHRAILALIDDL
jgi:anti-sigma factor (TIGR02949 family)